MSEQPSTLAGTNGGKRIVSKDKRVSDAYKVLKKMSRSGNYWANLTILGIESLTRGKLNNRNIFVNPYRSLMQPGTAHKDEFYVVLPGCTAVVERLPNDEYVVNDLQLDTAYFEKMEHEHSASSGPKLYKAIHTPAGWQTSENKTGRLKEERIVAVSDAGYPGPDDAVVDVAGRISDSPGQDTLRLKRHGFDMHFTPGRYSFGGLINYYNATHPLSDSEAHASALALAKTMIKAKDTKYVHWVSEFGGSTILTQAMAILVDQGITLPNHSIFMFRPKSVPHEALKLAHELKLNIGRDFSQAKSTDIIGNKGTIGMIYDRVKKEGESYTNGNALWDAGKSVTSIYGAARGVLAGAIVAIPALKATAAYPVLLGYAKTVGAALGGAAVAEKVFAFVAPKTHDKAKRLLK
ncbi:MAG: hypothetical protein OEZ39_14755 [Gammaproteobacteria bacterium]|nr:hypothetical protein [Gammaproteobacteria bacterium]MDH5653114.1 hypothetical protein [Gammaproteobacteria bacterium]